jgi:hypothetical protein
MLGKIWNSHIERELSSTRYATLFLINSNFIEIVAHGMRRVASINKSLIYCTPSSVKESQQ